MGTSPAGLTIRNGGQMASAIGRFASRLFQPPNDTIRGISPDSWYSPLQPVKPIAPAGTEPRGFQYWAGQNLLWTPRPDAEYSAADLKQLATYPLARMCIDNVKDALTSIRWEVQPRIKPGENRKEAIKQARGDDDIIALNRFFEYPDRIHNWADWSRELLEDMLVIDAGCVLVRKTFKGKVVELPVLRGEMITRYVDVNGFTPMPPQPAYAQNWWGIPLVDLTTDQLIYRPRNIVPRNTMSSQLYGCSPTEGGATELQVGIQRLAFTLAYYTEGSTPGVVQVVPRGTNPEKIAEAMAWMNSELAGNLAARRQWRLVQGFNDPGKNDQIEFTKEPLLTDMFDELHIRKICFQYGVSPQRLMRMMNRASAEASQEASEIEGLMPFLKWLKGVMDHIIQRVFGRVDCEMVFDPNSEADSEKQANVIKILGGSGYITKNEGRERLGEEKSSDPMADVLGMDTGTGFVPLGHVQEQADLQQQNVVANRKFQQQNGATNGNANPPKGSTQANGGPNGNRPAGGNPNGKAAGNDHGTQASAAATVVTGFQPQKGTVTFTKADRPIIHPGRLLPESIKAKHRLERILITHFGAMKRSAKKELRAALLKAAHIPANIPLAKARKFDSVQFNLDEADAKRVCAAIAFAHEDFAKGGIEDDSHVTVLFGLDGVTEKEIEAITAGTGAVPAVLGDLEVFDGKDETQEALVMRVESDKLVDLHNALATLPHTDTHPEYKPHICLAYLQKGAGAKYVAEGNPLQGKKIMLSDLVFSKRDKTTSALAKAAESEATKAILRAIAAEWREVAREAREPFEGASLAGVDNAVMQLDISDAGMLGEMNEAARDWAAARSAEMVGLKYNRAGRLVQNPDARWAISDTTREELRSIIADLFTQDEVTLAEIEDAIMDAGIFSDTRATMIARTEISRAQVQANLNAWAQSGLVRFVDWQMSSLHDRDDECDELEAGSPYPINQVPDFPAHPFCMCTLVISEETEDGG